MATSIAFNDGSAATLSNGLAAPGSRFRNWSPYTMPHGPREHALADGLPYKYVYRTDYAARFELPYIPNTELDVLLRLHRHLERGGQCTVNTGDAGTRQYTAVLAPGAVLQPPELSVPRLLLYTARFDLLNTAQADMLCEYP